MADNFKKEIAVEKLREHRLFVATPMYGAMCTGSYSKSIADLTGLCTRYGIQMQLYYLFNESLITRARNYCVDEFLRSEATHLMFIDSDIGFNPNDVLALLAVTIDESESYDVVGGPYPKKCISWEKIKQAVDKGVADDNPNVLDKYVGDYVFNPKSGSGAIPLNRPVEVSEIGTGFMIIPRKTFERYTEGFPQLMYLPDHVRTTHFDGTREIMCFFDALIDDKSQFIVAEIDAYIQQNPQATAEDIRTFMSDKKTGIINERYSNRYLSEDYMFCYNVQRLGMKVWLCPWMQLTHMGSYQFSGSMVDLASIGAAATADVSKIGKR